MSVASFFCVTMVSVQLCAARVERNSVSLIWFVSQRMLVENKTAA